MILVKNVPLVPKTVVLAAVIKSAIPAKIVPIAPATAIAAAGKAVSPGRPVVAAARANPVFAVWTPFAARPHGTVSVSANVPPTVVFPALKLIFHKLSLFRSLNLRYCPSHFVLIQPQLHRPIPLCLGVVAPNLPGYEVGKK